MALLSRGSNNSEESDRTVKNLPKDFRHANEEAGRDVVHVVEEEHAVAVAERNVLLTRLRLPIQRARCSSPPAEAPSGRQRVSHTGKFDVGPIVHTVAFTPAPRLTNLPNSSYCPPRKLR